MHVYGFVYMYCLPLNTCVGPMQGRERHQLIADAGIVTPLHSMPEALSHIRFNKTDTVWSAHTLGWLILYHCDGDLFVTAGYPSVQCSTSTAACLRMISTPCKIIEQATLWL